MIDELPPTINLNAEVEGVNLIRELEKRKKQQGVVYIAFNLKEAEDVINLYF